MMDFVSAIAHRLFGSQPHSASNSNQRMTEEEPDKTLARAWVDQLEQRVSETEANARIKIIQARERAQQRVEIEREKEPPT